MLLALSLPCAARAADPDPKQMLEEGARTIFGALELLMLSIPQYSAPEILPNGDIIIRRVQPMPKKNGDEPTKGTHDSETRT
ncbi:hypothetical protein [Magnetospira sp. QH-2]|uniref:hypothetical protein n=1 Tax=Magnetospira sp. (strain QH-2) TaxID=1288970 RepID=UPI0011DCF469|nr:hypothetical protein [Magnetospira sp. QH-2]